MEPLTDKFGIIVFDGDIIVRQICNKPVYSQIVFIGDELGIKTAYGHLLVRELRDFEIYIPKYHD